MPAVAVHRGVVARYGKHKRQASISTGKTISGLVSHAKATIPSKTNSCGAAGSNIASEFAVLQCFRRLGDGDEGTKNLVRAVCRGGEGILSQLKLCGPRSKRHEQLLFSAVVGDRCSHRVDRVWTTSCALYKCIPSLANGAVAMHHTVVAVLQLTVVRDSSWSPLHHTA